MTIRLSIDPTDAGRARYRSGVVQWPHVGECTFAAAVLRMVKQRDGGRVSAPGDAR